MTDYVMTLRTLGSDDNFTDQPGPTTYLELADNAPGYSKPAIASDTKWFADLIAQVPVEKDATGIERGDVLVFVHGYNNTIELVLQRHRLLKRLLPRYGFKGTVVSFDWPCDDVALAYIEDRQRAKQTAFALVKDGILPMVRRQATFDCKINVHVLAHSTGAYVIQEAFDDADDNRVAGTLSWTVSQIALISGDLAASNMVAGNSETESIYRHCIRLTNYSNAHDEVLQISNAKRIGLEPRVGRVGLPPEAPPVAVNIDCSEYYETSVASTLLPDPTLSHSWQFGDLVFTDDLAQTLNGDLDRALITTRTPLGPNRFQLKTGG